MFIFKLLILLSFAELKKQSFVCQEQSIKYPGQILCCDNIPGENCQTTQQQLLTKNQRQKSEWIINNSLLNETGNGIINCFRTALELVEQPILSPDIALVPKDFLASIDGDYIELTNAIPQAGDLLLFEEVGSYKFWEELTTGFGKRFYWQDSSLILHALVYLGDGLVIQKENATSAVISISTLDRALEQYGIASKETIVRQFYVQKRTEVILRLFRKKSI